MYSRDGHLVAQYRVIILGGLVAIGFTFEWNNTLGVIHQPIIASLHSPLGLSLITAVIGAFPHESKKIIPILLRPFFFISGIFFTNSIPTHFREILLWNPLLHFSELIRMFTFEDYQSSHGNLRFFFTVSILSLFLGLYVYRVNQLRLVTSGMIR